MASVNADAAFELTCGRWDCPAPSCGGLKKLAARELFLTGVNSAFDRGERVRFLTITPPAEGMSMSEVKVGWNRVANALKRRGVLREYAAVVELQGRGEPHLHVLTTGEYLPQDELSSIVQGRPSSKGRFGQVVDIREVRSTGPRSAPMELVGYMAKRPGGGMAEELARYASKAGTAERSRLRLHSRSTRTRPVRTSRLWYPGGLTGAAEAVKDEWSSKVKRVGIDATDWQICHRRQDTGQLVILNPAARVAPPEVDRGEGLAVVSSIAPALLQAA